MVYGLWYTWNKHHWYGCNSVEICKSKMSHSCHSNKGRSLFSLALLACLDRLCFRGVIVWSAICKSIYSVTLCFSIASSLFAVAMSLLVMLCHFMLLLCHFLLLTCHFLLLLCYYLIILYACSFVIGHISGSAWLLQFIISLAIYYTKSI